MGSLRPGKLVLLLLFISVATQSAAGFKRKKREWIIPPTRLIENVDYTKMPFIAKIRSDKDTPGKAVEYFLKGHGADEEPFNIFVVNPKTGYVRVTSLLDREEISQYNLTGIAKFADGSVAEEDIMLKIQVEDQNDNPPKFKFFKGAVSECSKIGTPVMQITAVDADQKGTINSKIAYSIVKQVPEGSGSMFTIDRNTGKLFIKERTLDRETHDAYTLIVKGMDLDGATNGNTGTGTVEIKVLDINDNVPTLEKGEYAGNVDEQAVNVVVMRIKAMDKDLENTDNWLVIFDIVKGNEEELFTIETDPKTNEGILKLIKSVDYEKVKLLELGLSISNVAPFINGTALSLGLNVDLEGSGVSAGTETGVGVGVDAGAEAGVGVNAGGNVGLAVNTGVDVDIGVEAGAKPEGKPGVKPIKKPTLGEKSYPVKISVNNLPEGPGFSPPVKEFPVSENPDEISILKMIGSFPALDGDTGEIAENVRYAKGYDPDNWISIDEETSEIKLTKIPDRESTFLVNGTYFVKILCMTKEAPPKTATGTIALKVQDSNDNCPELTSNYKNICFDDTVVNVTAFDKDIHPNGLPYKFVLIEEETQGKWEMVPVNETTVSFHAKEILWPGFYELSLEIFDRKGLGCKDKQRLQVEVCTCSESGTCNPRTAKQHAVLAKLGFQAIGTIVGSLLLLMLILLLLLFCHCGAVGDFTELPLDAKEYLITYHTEGKGEDKEVPLFSAPSVTDPDIVKMSGNASSKMAMLSTKGFGGVMNHELHTEVEEMDNFSGYQHNSLRAEQTLFPKNSIYSISSHDEMHDIYDDIALPDYYLHNYFSQKVSCLAENPSCGDSPLLYSDEGQNSPVGSLCGSSLIGSDTDLEFLNNLDPKFITLAEICSCPKLSLQPPKPEQTKTNIRSVLTSSQSEHSISTSAVSQSVQSSAHQDTITTVTKTINKSGSPSYLDTCQAILMQQQPLYYLVEQQGPSTVILAENPARGMYMIKGATGTEGLVFHEGNVELDTVEQNGIYLIDGASMVQRGIVLGGRVATPKLANVNT